MPTEEGDVGVGRKRARSVAMCLRVCNHPAAAEERQVEASCGAFPPGRIAENVHFPFELALERFARGSIFVAHLPQTYIRGERFEARSSYSFSERMSTLRRLRANGMERVQTSIWPRLNVVRGFADARVRKERERERAQ